LRSIERRRWTPHAADYALRETVRVSTLQELVQTIPTEPLRGCGASSPLGKSHHEQVAGCGGQLAKRHQPPSVTVQAVTSCPLYGSHLATRKTKAGALGLFGQSILDALSHHTTPAFARATPLACNCHVSCPTKRTHAIGLWVQHSTAPTILSERSSLSPGKGLHHQRSSSSHDASPHPQGERPEDLLNSPFP
jgi:hypothetical protein